MGATASTPAFHVFFVQPGSVADTAGLESLFDVIVELNGSPVDEYSFYQAARSNEPLDCTVVNTRYRSQRNVVIPPRAADSAGKRGIGATVRWTTLESVQNIGVRVVSMTSGSLAEKVGLVAQKDFLLATENVHLTEVDDLTEALQSQRDGGVTLAVYNTDEESVRYVEL